MFFLFSCSVMSNFCNPMDCNTPGFPVRYHLPDLLKLKSIESIQSSHTVISSSVVPFSYCLLSFPASESFSKSGLFTSGGQIISFSFNISSSNEHPGRISFTMDWMALLAVQGTLKSLLQYHTSKASILLHSDFLVQLSHPYVTTGKTIALTRRTFVGKVISLLFNMPSRLVIAFLPRSKRLLISRLQSPSAVSLEPKNKVSHCFPIYLP